MAAGFRMGCGSGNSEGQGPKWGFPGLPWGWWRGVVQAQWHVDTVPSLGITPKSPTLWYTGLMVHPLVVHPRRTNGGHVTGGMEDSPGLVF